MMLRTCTRLGHRCTVKMAGAVRPSARRLLASFERQSATFVVLLGCVLVGLVAHLDRRTSPEVSCAGFYLVPIAMAAWWGGFPHGILLALAATLAWHALDAGTTPPAARLCNALIRFGTFALTSALLSRLRR